MGCVIGCLLGLSWAWSCLFVIKMRATYSSPIHRGGRPPTKLIMTGMVKNYQFVALPTSPACCWALFRMVYSLPESGKGGRSMTLFPDLEARMRAQESMTTIFHARFEELS